MNIFIIFLRSKGNAYGDANTHVTPGNSALLIYTKYYLSRSSYMCRYYYFIFRVLTPTFFKRYCLKKRAE